MFHVKHFGNAGNTGVNPAGGFAGEEGLRNPVRDFSFWESLEKMI